MHLTVNSCFDMKRPAHGRHAGRKRDVFFMKRFLALLLPVLLLASSLSQAAQTSLETLKSLPAPELPVRAGELVKQARSGNREATAIEVTKAGVAINPASAPIIVGAIARAVPQVAALSASVAAAELPAQAPAITRAAASAAPTAVGQIVAAVCRVVPNQFRAIAVAASEAVPGSSRQILSGIGEAFPDLKPAIERALAGGSAPAIGSTVSTLQPATATVTASFTAPPVVAGSAPGAAGLRGPVIGPPYIPLSGTSTNVNPGTSGDQPPGGRNYAAP
jgi:hypothetical protein